MPTFCIIYVIRYGINAILRDLYMEKRSGKIENFLRMSDDDFHLLLNAIAPMISKQDTVMRKSISAIQRFVVTLRFLASGETYEDLQYVSRISPQALSLIVIEVCEALITVLTPQMQVRKNEYKNHCLLFIQNYIILYLVKQF